MKNEQRIEHAWEEIRARNLDEAERIFEEETIADPANIDAWNGLGAVHFERGDLTSSLASYERAVGISRAAHGGKFPERLPWTDENKPVLRAVHGTGLNLFRLGKFADARREFELLLRLNPEDNQGAAIFLRDIAKKAKLWKEDAAKAE
jgi:tetratricopeptide (TPR) repeat protein